MNVLIEGEKVFLREFRSSDTEKIFQMSIEPGMKQWIPDQVYADLEKAGQVLEFLIGHLEKSTRPDAGPVVLGVCLAESGELIGHVGLSPIAAGVEIGYAIEEARQGRGYAVEAIKLMCRWAFEHFGLNEIKAVVAAENARSCRALEKAGFVFNSHCMKIYHGKERDVRYYSIFPEVLFKNS
ncbi:MAG: GNAT family protein [Candidatus Riflebacteria bacterium]